MFTKRRISFFVIDYKSQFRRTRLIFVYDIMLFSRYLKNVKGNIALFAHSQFGAVQNVKSGREI